MAVRDHRVSLPATVRAILRRLSVRHSRRSRGPVWLAIGLTIVILIGTACAEVDESNTTSTSGSGYGAAQTLVASPTTASNDTEIASTVSFPQLIEQTAGMDALLTGALTMTDGCLRVADSLIIWPPGYQVRTNEGEIEVVDSAGKVVARVGEEVSLGGGQGAMSPALDGQLSQPVPEQCSGPYWIASQGSIKLGGMSEASVETCPTPTAGRSSKLPTDDPLVQDAQSYAGAHGISLEEARHRLEIQPQIGELAQALEANERETFAGLWIQHEPEFRVVVRFTQDGEATLQRYVAGGPLADLVEVRPARVTLAQLVDDQAAVSRTLEAAGIYVSSGVNLFENQVELNVTDRAKLEADLQEAGIDLPDTVVIVAEDMGVPMPVVPIGTPDAAVETSAC